MCFFLNVTCNSVFNKSKEEGKDQETIQPGTTPETGHLKEKCQ